MVRTVFAGDTPDFLLTIKDANGNNLDASNNTVVKNVYIVAYSRLKPEKIAGKYALYPTGDYADYETLQTEDGNIKLILSSEATQNCVNEEIVAQITTVLANTSYPSGEQVLTGADVICKVLPLQG